MFKQIRGTVTYDGGEVVAWQARPKDIKAMEDYARRHGYAIEEALSPTLGMFVAYSALGVPEGFDTWLESLEDFEDLTGDDVLDPSRPGASLEGGSSSRSLPAGRSASSTSSTTSSSRPSSTSSARRATARTSVKGGLSIEVDGLVETLRALRSVEAELRPEANGLIRDAAGRCAGELLPYLEASAARSGVPVAPRVARSMRVKRDRMPTVSIGGATAVGRRGARAGALVWGSEQGPKGAVNHFGVPPGPGYWIAPAVDAFKQGPAVATFLRAVVLIFKRYGLL